ncbi:dual E2 ubiquitin-conjugating enzyme/E3 ubiquitin-protein ligase BIRC6-like [Chironomus tepperi]|uniref:dual E2 ubiquitin-conjugating enzyme/E3 ubiquitin-protein ligase BIRC6-like n=1 Tax=Chironomus tepperi TaxID=113505 RepID=UPI00391F43C7
MANQEKHYFSHYQNFYFPAVKDLCILAINGSLPSLQFNVLSNILDNTPLTTKDGILIRKSMIETGQFGAFLNILGIFTHNNPELLAELTKICGNSIQGISTWKAEKATNKQEYAEKHIKIILEILSSFLNPKDGFQKLDPAKFDFEPRTSDILKKFLIPVLSFYLDNESIMDIAKKVPIYHLVLKTVRGLALSPCLSNLLAYNEEYDSKTIKNLVNGMKAFIEVYTQQLKNKNLNYISDREIESLDLELLATCNLIDDVFKTNKYQENIQIVESPISLEDKYLQAMKKLQYDSFEMIKETRNGPIFTVPYTFESNVFNDGFVGHSDRNKRLIQESATLSTCLPLSFNSSIFIRQDSDRLDIVKCLITGPSNTPYANGCFEFDAYYPPNYPNRPVAMAYKTVTGDNQYINPNLYNNGLICLSILNTWAGSPDSMWNPLKSTLMEVLIAIQTSVFVSDPYFNEPDFQKLRGTEIGELKSRLYKCKTYYLTVQFAIIEQICKPSPCFIDVIYTHFWLKRNEIFKQVKNWMEEAKFYSQCGELADHFLHISEKLSVQYQNLYNLLSNLPVPNGMNEFDNKFTGF